MSVYVHAPAVSSRTRNVIPITVVAAWGDHRSFVPASRKRRTIDLASGAPRTAVRCRPQRHSANATKRRANAGAIASTGDPLGRAFAVGTRTTDANATQPE